MIHIVCCTDDNYAFNFPVLAQSVLHHHPAQEVWFHLMHSPLSAYSESGIQSFVAASGAQFTAYPIDDRIFDALPRIAYFGVATYFRFLIPELLPASLDKVLYLDMDIIVEGRLDALWRLPMAEHSVAVVEDGIAHHLGDLAPAIYFNAGMMLINIAYWREHDVKRAAIETLKAHVGIMKFGDQDALNVVLNQSKTMVDRKWNAHVMVDRKTLRRAAKGEAAFADRPVVIHFNQKIKPWMYHCRHAYTGRYREILRSTPFRDYKIKNADLTGFLFYLTPGPLRSILWSESVYKLLKR